MRKAQRVIGGGRRRSSVARLADDWFKYPEETSRHFSEALEKGQIKGEELGIKELAEEFMVSSGGERIGVRWVRECCDPRNGGLMESIDGVDSTAFANITGQILVNEIMTAYQDEDYVLSNLVPNRPTKLSGEKILGLTRIGADGPGVVVKEGMPIPAYGFGEDYVQTPATDKRALMVNITKEAIFFDLTNQLIQQAGTVGAELGRNKEKRLLDLLLGITNSYNWRGTAYNTYQSSTPWINVLTSTELIDWMSIEKAELLFANMLDPNISEPISIDPKHLFVMPYKKHTARRIVRATSIRVGDGATATTATYADNPLDADYQILSSKLAYRELQTAGGISATNAQDYWFLGDLSKAFAYMENWPITIVQQPSGNEADFTQDIVHRIKASERGAAAVMEPRAVVKVTKTP